MGICKLDLFFKFYYISKMLNGQILNRPWQNLLCKIWAMGSQKKEAILQAKGADNFVKKAKWAKISFEFLDCMALATSC